MFEFEESYQMSVCYITALHQTERRHLKSSSKRRGARSTGSWWRTKVGWPEMYTQLLKCCRSNDLLQNWKYFLH